MNRGDHLLALLLSAVSNEVGECKSDPCPTCSVAETAQEYLNDLQPANTTGWWWEEEDEGILSALNTGTCVHCQGLVWWIECPTGGWWKHHTHPEDGHDAEVISREDAEDYCIHSMVKWDCLGCVQGHARRVEAENQRFRAVLEKFVRCPLHGHETYGLDTGVKARYETPRTRRVDCYDDQCENADCIKYVECKHPSHDAVEALAGILPRKE